MVCYFKTILVTYEFWLERFRSLPLLKDIYLSVHRVKDTMSSVMSTEHHFLKRNTVHPGQSIVVFYR